MSSLEEAEIDSFHIDIMAERYVNNFAMLLYDMGYIAKVSHIPFWKKFHIKKSYSQKENLISNICNKYVLCKQSI